MDPNTTMDPSTSSSSSLVVSYLMNSCGLSEVQALKASRNLNFKTTSRADIVKTLLERSGFTKPDITKLIIRAPKALLFARRSILKQKLDYFFSKDISRQEAVKALSHSPGILFRSLEDRIIPCFNFFKSIVGNDRDTLTAIRNTYKIKLYCNKRNEEFVLNNIQVLKDENVPEEIIIKFLIQQPRVFMIGTERFKEAVEEVKGMGINPSKTAFTTSIRMSISHAKTTLETKLDAFRKWWSEEQIQTAIRKLPRFMEISVKKFEAIMDFAVTQMGCNPSSLALRPSLFYMNLEKRIIPRFSIHKILISKGLTGSKATILTILQFKDEVFLKKYVIPYKVEAPEVWQIYNQASNRHVVKDSKNEEVTFCRESSTENVAAPPKVAKVVDKCQTGKPKNKALPSDLMEQDEELEKEEEANKATKPKKILRKSKKKVEEMQGGGAKKDKGGQSNIEFDEEEKDKSNREEEIAAVPIVGKVSEGSQASELKRKVLKKVTKPKKVLKKSKKKIEEVQGSADKEEKKDTSKEKEESTALPMVGKVLEDEELEKEEEANKATKPKKILRKSKKKVEEMQGGGAKKDKGGHSNIEFDEEQKDKSNREEEVAVVPIVGKVSEGSQASGLKRKVLKKVTKPKKVLKKSKKKIEEVQGSAAKKEEKDTSKEEEESTALPMVGKVLEDSPKKNLVINFGVEALELLQVSNRHAMEDLQREEVTFSPKSPTKTAPPKVAKVADKSQTGKPKKKASPSDLMEQGEELKNEKEAKKATKPKKILSEKKLEEVQGGGAKKDKGSHSNIEFNEGEKDKFEEEEEIAAVPIVGNVLEGSQINVLKRKVALDKEEDSKKVKRPKKIMVKSKKKVEEVQGGAVKEKGHSSIEVGEEEKDKSKAEEEIAAVPIVEEVLEGCEVSTLERKVVLNTDEDSKKVKKPKKVLKKSKKKVDKVQGSAKMEEEDKAKEVRELPAVPMVEKVSEEKDKSKAEEEIAAVPMVEEVSEGCEVSTLKRKVALSKDEDSKKVKKPKKVLKKSKKKIDEVQGSVKKVEEDKAKEVGELAAVPMVEKVLEDSQASVL